MKRILEKGLKNRFVRFAGIGVLCLVFVQQPVLLLLVGLGANALVANAAGFMLSALVNYEVQRRFNFGGQTKGSWLHGLAKFLVTSAASLAVSSVVFAGLYYGVADVLPEVATRVGAIAGGRFDVWAWVASFIGAVGGTGFSFVLSRTFIFGRLRPGAGEACIEVEVFPPLRTVQKAVDGKTLAFFMPAYNEAANLPRTVDAAWAYLRTLGLFDFRVIIVNDGSTDNTREVAEALAAKYEEVVVVHHPENRGYGGALQTGFRAAVESGCDLWGFTDADGQFDPKSIGVLLLALLLGDADLSVGYRLGRGQADSAFRLYLGRLWHFVGRIAVGRDADGKHLLSVRDVDCGLKVGWVKSLSLIVDSLHGQAAAISPELIARTNLAGQTIVQRGVTHLPRLAGTSTGDDPRVMLRSVLNIARLGLRLRLTKYFGWTLNAAEDALLNMEA